MFHFQALPSLKRKHLNVPVQGCTYHDSDLFFCYLKTFHDFILLIISRSVKRIRKMNT